MRERTRVRARASACWAGSHTRLSPSVPISRRKHPSRAHHTLRSPFSISVSRSPLTHFAVTTTQCSGTRGGRGRAGESRPRDTRARVAFRPPESHRTTAATLRPRSTRRQGAKGTPPPTTPGRRPRRGIQPVLRCRALCPSDRTCPGGLAPAHDHRTRGNSRLPSRGPPPRHSPCPPGPAADRALRWRRSERQ